MELVRFSVYIMYCLYHEQNEKSTQMDTFVHQQKSWRDEMEPGCRASHNRSLPHFHETEMILGLLPSDLNIFCGFK